LSVVAALLAMLSAVIRAQMTLTSDASSHQPDTKTTLCLKN